MSGQGLSEELIRDIVRDVLAGLPSPPAPSAAPAVRSPGRHGVFERAEDAARAARQGFEQLSRKGWAGRARVVEIVKSMCAEHAVRWGQLEFEETRIGRLDHKIEKLQGIRHVLGTEYLMPQGMSGDAGITMDESGPWGVVGSITPVTHSVPTLAGNVVNMVAAGNAVVFNPHPGGAACAAQAVHEFNEAIRADLGIENLICTVEKPSLDSFHALCAAEEVALLCITGGPAVV
jgi:aldehyde dehydrogenase